MAHSSYLGVIFTWWNEREERHDTSLSPWLRKASTIIGVMNVTRRTNAFVITRRKCLGTCAWR
jgi:hypothetical protein